MESVSKNETTQQQDSRNIELWYGTQLAEPEMPVVEWLVDEQMKLNNTFSSIGELGIPNSEIDPVLVNHVGPVEKSTLEQTFKEEIASSSFAGSPEFADPLDIDMWNLVKWTCVVLFIAGLATYVFRKKQGVSSHRFKSDEQKKLSTSELTHLSTLAIRQNSMLHVVMLGDERYLIATDMTGVKSVTLVPNWNLNESGESDLEDVLEMRTEDSSSPTLAISEVG